MAHLKNHSNEYADAVGNEFFDGVPKSVWAAIAVSALTLGGDYLDEAAKRVAEEWQALYDNRIVTQKPHALAKRAMKDAAP